MVPLGPLDPLPLGSSVGGTCFVLSFFTFLRSFVLKVLPNDFNLIHIHYDLCFYVLRKSIAVVITVESVWGCTLDIRYNTW